MITHLHQQKNWWQHQTLAGLEENYAMGLELWRVSVS